MSTALDTKLVLQELRKIGLSPKESKVYMGLLTKGPMGAQKIATTFGFTRPTAYRLLEDLRTKELITKQSIPGKKIKKYCAKSPDELIGLLRIKKREIEEQERELLRIISELRTTYYHEQAPIVTYKFSSESLKVIYEDVCSSQAGTITIYHHTESPLSEKALQNMCTEITKRRPKVSLVISHKSQTLDFKGTVIITEKAYIISGEEITILDNPQVVAFFNTCFTS